MGERLGRESERGDGERGWEEGEKDLKEKRVRDRWEEREKYVFKKDYTLFNTPR